MVPFKGCAGVADTQEMGGDIPVDGRVDLSVDAWVRARAMASLYLAGAVIGAVSMLLPHSAKAHDAALWSNIGLAFFGG
ncbi:MAG: hypothetical protein QOH13_2730, partial [Thermoleophilaceae bacterium]|nr:hypothetical protein [Thermoleophilaceae bacterium]